MVDTVPPKIVPPKKDKPVVDDGLGGDLPKPRAPGIKTGGDSGAGGGSLSEQMGALIGSIDQDGRETGLQIMWDMVKSATKPAMAPEEPAKEEGGLEDSSTNTASPNTSKP